MLDWQGKKWVKVIAVTVVFTFLVFDIAWAMDFSPIAITAPSSSDTPGLLPRIGSFISRSILKREHKEEMEDTTEVSFRTQLVPRKKYGEESGFQRIDAVKEMIKRQMDEMNRRQAIENDRRRQIYNQYQVDRNLHMQNAEKVQAFDDVQRQVLKARGDVMGAAAAAGEFSYTLTKEGTRINYTDGLPSSIENERITDSYGYESIKNTRNMKYNSNRLLVSYDAEVIDSPGNVTRIQWRNGVYSDDSVWWASSDSNAGKYMLGYTETTTDPYGTTTIREWSTAREAYDSAKKVTSYSEIMKDALGNILSSSQWSGGVYDGDNLTSYHQETTDSYGNIYITDWQGAYNDGGRIISVVTEDKQINRDLSTSESKSTTTYEYDAQNKLVSAVGKTTVKGDDGFANMHEGTTTYNYKHGE